MKNFNFQKNASRILIFVVALAFTSCISQKKVWMLQDQDKTETSVFTNPQKTAYKVQTGDHLFIKIYSMDKETSKFFQTDFPTLMNPTYLYLNSYPVDEEGYLNFSFIDKLYVQGLSIDEIQNNIQKTMNEYFKDVTVSVKLVNFKISVLGEVKLEGEYTITQDQINIFEAIALGRGIEEFGNRKKVTLIRQTQTGSEVHYLDLTDKKILESPYYYLMPNDIVYVESRKSKSWALDKLPYSVFISTISLIIAIMALN
jgi:polysaccharide biosynthesis/export protein